MHDMHKVVLRQPGGDSRLVCGGEFLHGFVMYDPKLFACTTLCPWRDECKKGELDMNPKGKKRELAEKIVAITRDLRRTSHWKNEHSIKRGGIRLAIATEKQLSNYLEELEKLHSRAMKEVDSGKDEVDNSNKEIRQAPAKQRKKYEKIDKRDTSDAESMADKLKKLREVIQNKKELVSKPNSKEASFEEKIAELRKKLIK